MCIPVAYMSTLPFARPSVFMTMMPGRRGDKTMIQRSFSFPNNITSYLLYCDLHDLIAMQSPVGIKIHRLTACSSYTDMYKSYPRQTAHESPVQLISLRPAYNGHSNLLYIIISMGHVKHLSIYA